MSAAKRAMKESASQAQLAKYPPEIAEHYIIKDTIGTGGFAKVKLARHKLTDEKVAIKVMDKEQLRKTNDLQRVALEIQALRELQHQNIAKLYQVVETEEKFFLVLEYAPGGELFDYIVARDRLKEQEARVFFRQIVAAVAYCHSKGFIHRDLKPENLLLDANQNIKLIDFGLISHPPDIAVSRLTTCCGSAAYAAPELIRGEPYLGPPADIWSLGILLYALLCGFLPFDDENTQRLYRLIQRGQYEVPVWLSEESQRLIGSLLRHKPEQRLTMEQLLSHPWMLKGLSIGSIPWNSVLEGVPLDGVVVGELCKYFGADVATMESLIRERNFDRVTAAYELMCLRRSKGRSVRLPGGRSHLPPTKAMALLATHKLAASEADLSNSTLSGSVPSLAPPSVSVLSHTPPLPGAKDSPNASALDSGLTPLSGRDRWASQVEGLDMDSSLSRGGRTSSHPELFSPARATPRSGLSQPPEAAATTTPHHASEGGAAAATSAAASAEPQHERKSLGGSLRSLARSIQHLFGSSHSLNEPREVKGLFNMSTTSTKTPADVKAEVVRVLQEMGLEYKEKGFVVKARIMDAATGKEKVGLSLEVCHVMRTDLTGIKLTRLKGDTWAYKKACQDIVAQMHL